MKYLFTSIMAFLLVTMVKAQPLQAAAGSLSGVIKDSTTQLPLTGATIRLNSANNTATPLATNTDFTGKFSFQNLQAGDYDLVVSFVGFEQKTIKIKQTDKAQIIPDIFLSIAATTQNSVTVTATKALIENKVDRIVYNVEKDITAQSGVATDVLRKVPQLSVDANGNVELLGNPSIRFLIDGKPSVMFGNNAAEALQSIPANQIQSIEVMSSPGAKYDATGTGGVINIILKKNKAAGYSGVVNTTVGSRQENGSVNLNYKKSNVSVSGYFSGTALMKVKTLTDLDRQSKDIASGDTYNLIQHGSSDLQRHGIRSGLGLDWDLSQSDNISLSVGYNEFGNKTNGMLNQISQGFDAHQVLQSTEKSINNKFNDLNVKSLELSGSYLKKFKKDRETLSLTAIYSTDKDRTAYDQTLSDVQSLVPYTGSRSVNPGRDHLASFALDYALPFSDNFLLETGVKTELESLISDANVYNYEGSVKDFILDPKQSYTSTFKRKVYAAYASGSFSAFKWLDVIAGLRWEHTENDAHYSNIDNVDIPNYDNVGPALTLSHQFDNDQTLSFSFAYRLERPDYKDLNPFINLADPHNITTGNPFLKSEIGRDFQLGYNVNFKGGNNLNIMLIYIYNNPDIKAFTTFYPSFQVADSTYENVNLTKRDNIASENRWGANIGGSFNVFPKFTIRPNVQIYYRTTNNERATPSVISGVEYRASLNANYQFAKGLYVEGFGNYRSGLKWQGTQPPFYIYSLAVKKDLFKGNGSIGLVAINAFNKYLTQNATQEGTGFFAHNNLKIPYRSFGLSFMYKFGSQKIKQKAAVNFLDAPPVQN